MSQTALPLISMYLFLSAGLFGSIKLGDTSASLLAQLGKPDAVTIRHGHPFLNEPRYYNCSIPRLSLPFLILWTRKPLITTAIYENAHVERTIYIRRPFKLASDASQTAATWCKLIPTRRLSCRCSAKACSLSI